MKNNNSKTNNSKNNNSKNNNSHLIVALLSSHGFSAHCPLPASSGL
jgi:hypothetical protein